MTHSDRGPKQKHFLSHLKPADFPFLKVVFLFVKQKKVRFGQENELLFGSCATFGGGVCGGGRAAEIRYPGTDVELPQKNDKKAFCFILNSGAWTVCTSSGPCRRPRSLRRRREGSRTSTRNRFGQKNEIPHKKDF